MDQHSMDALVQQARRAILTMQHTAAPVDDTQRALMWLNGFRQQPAAWVVFLHMLRTEMGAVQLHVCSALLSKLRSAHTLGQDTRGLLLHTVRSFLTEVACGARTIESRPFRELFAAFVGLCGSLYEPAELDGMVGSLLHLAVSPGAVHAALSLSLLRELQTAVGMEARHKEAVLRAMEVALLGQEVDAASAAHLSAQVFPPDLLSSTAGRVRGRGERGGEDNEDVAVMTLVLLAQLKGLKLHDLHLARPALLLSVLTLLAAPLGLRTRVVADGSDRGGVVGVYDSFDVMSQLVPLIESAGHDVRATRAVHAWRASRAAVTAAGGAGHHAGAGPPTSREGVVLGDTEYDATLRAFKSFQCAVAVAYERFRAFRTSCCGGEGGDEAPFWANPHAKTVYCKGLYRLSQLGSALVLACPEVAAAGIQAPHSPKGGAAPAGPSSSPPVPVSPVDTLFAELLLESCHSTYLYSAVEHGVAAVTKIAHLSPARRGEAYRQAFFSRAASTLFHACRYPPEFPSTGSWETWACTPQAAVADLTEPDWELLRHNAFPRALDGAFSVLGTLTLQLLVEDPLIIQAACKLIASYSSWIIMAQGNGELPGQCLGFVARAMSTPETATAATSALSLMVARAAPVIAGHPNLPRVLAGTYAGAYTALSPDARRSAGSAMMNIASALPGFADAAGMVMSVAGLSIAELEKAVGDAQAIVRVKAAGGAPARAKLRTGTLERAFHSIMKPLCVLGEMAVHCRKEAPVGHPAIILSPGSAPVPARHLALMLLHACLPALQALFMGDEGAAGGGGHDATMSSKGGGGGGGGDQQVAGGRGPPPSGSGSLLDALSGSDVHACVCEFLEDVGRAVCTSPQDVPSATLLLLSILRSAMRATQDPVYPNAVGKLANVVGAVLVKLLNEAVVAAEGGGASGWEGVERGLTAPVYSALTATARESTLLCLHLIASNQVYCSGEQEGTWMGHGVSAPLSPPAGAAAPAPFDVGRARTPPALFTRVNSSAGGYDASQVLCSVYSLLASLACAAPLTLFLMTEEAESSPAAARMVQSAVARRMLATVAGQPSPAHVSQAGEVGAGQAGALLGSFDANLAALLPLLLDHGMSIVSELDRDAEAGAVLSLLNALHRLRYSLHAGRGVPFPSQGLEPTPSHDALSSPAVALSNVDMALSKIAGEEDLSGRGGSAAYSFLSLVPVQALPALVVDPLLRNVDAVVGEREVENASTILACSILTHKDDHVRTKHATAVALIAHSCFAAACGSGALAPLGVQGHILCTSLPSGVACQLMGPFVSAVLARAVTLAGLGVESLTQRLAGEAAARAGSPPVFLPDERPVGVCLDLLTRPDVQQRVAHALTLALFGSREGGGAVRSTVLSDRISLVSNLLRHLSERGAGLWTGG